MRILAIGTIAVVVGMYLAYGAGIMSALNSFL